MSDFKRAKIAPVVTVRADLKIAGKPSITGMQKQSQGIAVNTQKNEKQDRARQYDSHAKPFAGTQHNLLRFYINFLGLSP